MACFRGRRNQTTDNRIYSETIRKFVLTLYVYSPKAYKYLREKMANTLPFPRTLTKWFAESACNGEPGALIEAMKTLKNVAMKLNAEGKQLVGTLSFDEMAIRRHIQYDHQKKQYSGLIHYGKRKDDGTVPIANNVIVFMYTALNYKVSIPISYYAITSLDWFEKKNLIVEMITALHSIDARVVNITCDGLNANLLTFEALGVSLDPANIVPYFHLPNYPHKIYVLLDSCHMLKLLRNALGDLGYITDPLNGKIEWKHFIDLEALRRSENYVPHKLTQRHIQYTSNRMNVRLATQTFSNSVAAAMEHLMLTEHEKFQNIESTIYFTRNVNNIFDATNTKNIRNDSIFKSALNPENANLIFQKFAEMDTYIRRLKFNRKFCIESRRKTGFIGFLVNMISIRMIYEDLVAKNVLEYLPTFYLSQDLLESMFGRIRALLGSNDNPTAQQIKACIRKLLFFNEVCSSEFSNCEDNLDILTVSSNKSSPSVEIGTIHVELNTAVCDIFSMDDEEDSMPNSSYLQNISSNEDTTIAYLAGSIEIQFQSNPWKCSICQSIFTDNEKIDGPFLNNTKTQRPCKSTFLICKIVHLFIDETKVSPEFDYQHVVNSSLRRLESSDVILYRNTDFSHENDHLSIIVKDVIDEYIRKYCTYLAKSLTLEQQKKHIRHINKRVTIFNGQ